MSKLKSNQSGFSVIEILIVIAVLVVIGFVGWRFISTKQQADNGTSQSQQAPEVNNSDDLKEAEEFVEGTDVDGQLDTSEIDSALNQ